MTYDELMARLTEIRAEFCPTPLEKQLEVMEQGYNELCGCPICRLTEDLLIAEISHGTGIEPAELPQEARQ